jgi:hypothetical protein
MSSSRLLWSHGLFIALAMLAALVGEPAVARAQVELIVPITNTVGIDSVTV